MENFAIEMLNIRKEFSGIVANDDITLQLRKGEIHALLGENGAGKSTLMSVLFGLYQPEKGVIKSIDGAQIAECMSGVKCVEIMKRAGETVSEVRNSNDRLGFVITQAENAEQAVAIADAAAAVIRADI